VSDSPRPRVRRGVQRARIAARRRSAGVNRPLPPPPSWKRRIPAWVLLVAALPVLLLTVVGAYALTIVVHTQRAVGDISAPSVAMIVHSAETSTPDLRPTNTPDTRGVVAPLPTAPSTPTPLPPQFNRKEPLTVMLLGVEDQRNGLDDSSRSDTIILAYIDPSVPHVNLLSIPRDLRVTQPGGRGLAKIADVYANGDAIKYKGNGGVAFVWDTIEQNFQLRIDYYVRANFDGFTKIVDTVGGVTVDTPYPIKDDTYPTPDFQYARVFFPAGIVHLDGAEALRYVRTRHDDSDFGRNTRQQQVILSIREQAKKLNLLSHATDLIDSLGKTFRTDLPPEQWLGFAKFGTDLPSAALQQLTLVDLLQTRTINGIDYDLIDWPHAVARAREFSPKESKQALQAAVPQTILPQTTVVAGRIATSGDLAARLYLLLVVGVLIRRKRNLNHEDTKSTKTGKRRKHLSSLPGALWTDSWLIFLRFRQDDGNLEVVELAL